MVSSGLPTTREEVIGVRKTKISRKKREIRREEDDVGRGDRNETNSR